MTNNKSNFSFLSGHWAFLQSDARQVETYALRDPRAASIYARRTLEISLKWLFANDTALKRPYEKSLAAMIHEPTFAKNIRKGLFHDIKFIHRLGNIAVHGDQEISEQEGLKATVALHQFLGWLARVYTKGGAKPEQFHINQRSDRQDLSSLQPKKEITGRYYQMEAAARVMENFGAKRKRNVKAAFNCPEPEKLKQKNIVLIDDVATTGATLEVAASALKAAGAKQVWGLVLARG